MPLYILDANSIGALMGYHPRMVANVGRHQGQIISTVIVRGEVVFGLSRLPAGRRRTRLANRAAQVFAAVSWSRITLPIADTYGQLKASLMKQGIQIRENDLWNAATGLTLRAVLVTNDQHYAWVPNLQVEDWTQ